MKFVLLYFFLAFPLISFSQINAVTETGKKVVLNEDGTWKWVEEDKSKDVLNLSEGINAESDRRENYFTVSKRLDRYFSNPKNQIRGSSICVVENGTPMIKFIWEVYLGDGNRYFGYLKEGAKVNLITNTGEKIELILNEDVKTDIREKYNVTLFSGTASLSQDQLSVILSNSIKSVEVFWKKNSETYELKNKDDFKESFSSIME